MLYPTITELTKNEFNRYELALATAKCARAITDEYVEQKEAAEKVLAASKDSDRTAINLLNKEYREEKAVKNAITKIHNGDYKIVRCELSENEITEDATDSSEADA